MKATIDSYGAITNRAGLRPDDLGARRIAASTCQLVASLTGSEVRCKAGRVRAEAWEAQFPERDASVPRRQSSQPASPLRGCRAKGRETARGADRRLLLPITGGRLQRERSP